jgi:ABC-type polysaccharide/polyol phosphate export permease
MDPRGAASAGPAVWEHRTAKGVEYGGEVPRGVPPSGLENLFRAVSVAWRTRHLLWLTAINDYKASFRAQSLGMFWSVVNPLVMMLTITVAFTKILKINIPNFPIFYLTGAIFWQFFTSTLSGCTNAFIGKAALVRGTSFPRFMIPAIPIVIATINLVIEFVLLLLLYPIFPSAFAFGPGLLFIPVIFVLLLTLCIGTGLLTASLQVRFRDVTYVVSAVTTIGFWVTPILYSSTMAPTWVIPWLRLNPLAGVVEGVRTCVMDGRLPTLQMMLPTVVGAVVFFLLGAYAYQRENPRIADHL